MCFMIEARVVSGIISMVFVLQDLPRLFPSQAGTIPQELGDCVGLTELWLCQNSLEGVLMHVLSELL